MTLEVFQNPIFDLVHSPLPQLHWPLYLFDTYYFLISYCNYFFFKEVFLSLADTLKFSLYKSEPGSSALQADSLLFEPQGNSCFIALLTVITFIHLCKSLLNGCLHLPSVISMKEIFLFLSLPLCPSPPTIPPNLASITFDDKNHIKIAWKGAFFTEWGISRLMDWYGGHLMLGKEWQKIYRE